VAEKQEWRDALVVLKVSQLKSAPGIVPINKWDWTANDNEYEKWEIIACGLMIPLQEVVRNIASDRVIDAAEFAADAIAQREDPPPSMPAGMTPDPQEVTLEDFPAKEAPVVARFSDPEDYRERTGKRFRMTKDQKDRELSREEAFSEFLDGLSD